MKQPTCRWRERKMENRYKVWELLRRMKKTLECAICLDLLSDPYSSHCNHPFCRACITKVISSNKHPNCPLCKEPISRRSIHENTRLAEIVDSVKGLEDAVTKDSGIASTPPRPIPESQVTRGTPGIILHSLLHPTPRKEQMGPSQQFSSSAGTVSPGNTHLNCRRKRKRCLRARSTRQSTAPRGPATGSRPKTVPSAVEQGPAPTLYSSTSAPCLKTRRLTHHASSSIGEKTVGVFSNQEEMEIDTPPIATPTATTPTPTSHTKTPLTAASPNATPTATPPTAPPPGLATILSPTVIPATTVVPATSSLTDGDCLHPPASGAVAEHATPLNTCNTHTTPCLNEHLSCASEAQGSSLSNKRYSSPGIKSPSSGSSTDSLSPSSPLKQLAPTQTVTTTPEILDTTASPEVLVPETLDPEAPIHQECTQSVRTQVSIISDTLDDVANIAETPLLAYGSLDTGTPVQAAVIHCDAQVMGMPVVPSIHCTEPPTQCQHESMSKTSSSPPLADCIPDTLTAESSQSGSSITAHQCEVYSPAIPIQSYSLRASRKLSQCGGMLQSSSRKKRKILQTVKEEEEEEEGSDSSRPLVAVTPQKPLNSGEPEFLPPVAVLPGLRMPNSPCLPSSARPKGRRPSQCRQEGVRTIFQVTQDLTPPGVTQVHPTPPGVTQDHPTPTGTTQDHPTPLGVTQDHPTPQETTQDHPTPPRVTQDHPTPLGVTQDHPTPLGVTQDHPTPQEATQDHPTPQEATQDHPTPLGVTQDHPTPLGITQDHPTPQEATQDHPTPPRVTQDHPTPPGVIQDHPTPLGVAQDRPTPPGATQDCPTPPGATQDHPTLPGVAQDRPTPPGATQDCPTPPGATQDHPTLPGVAQDRPTPPGATGLPSSNGSNNTLSPALHLDMMHLTSASDKPQAPVCGGKAVVSVLLAMAETTPPSTTPSGVSPLSCDLSPSVSSSITELSFCTMVDSMDTQAVAILQKTLLEKQKEIEELDDILKKADGHREGQEDAAVLTEQNNALATKEAEEGSSTLVLGTERGSALVPGREESSLLLDADDDTGNRSSGGSCVCPPVSAVVVHDVLDQLLGGDATDDQNGRLVGLEDEEIAEQHATDCPYGSQVPGFEHAEEGNLQKLETPEHPSSTQSPEEHYSGFTPEAVAIPADSVPLFLPVPDEKGSVVTASPTAEASSLVVPIPPDQDELHVVLDSLPLATQMAFSDMSVQALPVMSALVSGAKGGGESGEPAKMEVDVGANNAETEQHKVVGHTSTVWGQQAEEDTIILQDDMETVPNPTLLEWRPSLSEDTRMLLQESRQLIQDIRGSGTAGDPTGRTTASACVATGLNDEDDNQSTLAITENLENFIRNGVKKGTPHLLPGPLTSDSSTASQQEGEGGKAAGVSLQEEGGEEAAVSEVLPPAQGRLMRTTAGWQSARRSSKLQFGASSNVQTPGERHKQTRARSKHRSLPEFWQPDTAKKKKLDFLVGHPAVPVDRLSASSSTTAHTQDVSLVPGGGLDTPSPSPALHTLNKHSSLQNTGESVREESHKHVPGSKPSAVVPANPVSKRQYSLVASGLRKTQMQRLKEFVHRFDLRLASTFNQCTSHVIIATDENRQCPRTLKYLQGIAGGRWIVSFDWVDESLRQGRPLPESVFEVSCDSVSSVPGVPRIARTNHNGKGLLHGCHVVLCGEFKEMSRDQVAQLLKLSGAQLITEGEAPPASSSGWSLSICDVACTCPEGDQASSKGGVVSLDWVIDSLSSFRVLPLDGYLLQQGAT